MNSIVDEVLKDAEGKTFVMLAEGQLKYILSNCAETFSVLGDIVEMGCNIGMTSSYLQRLIKATKVDKTLHVYDSFEGLPPKTAEDGATPCDKGASAVSIEMFKKTFDDAILSYPVINKGFFGDIPDNKYPDKICFAFFDGDFYSSITDSFKKVYHKMQPGGVILVHDYKWVNFPGAALACETFLADKPEKMMQDIFGIGKMVKA
jgi:O-methyltransferase